MPIRSLESFLFENKLVSTCSIDLLRDATIGIDVEHYLSRIYTYKKEQCLSAIGGVPSSLRNYIQSDLKVFEEYNIKPLFVLPGLKVNHARTKHHHNELSHQEQHLEGTWSRLHSRSTLPVANTQGLNGDSFRFNLDPLPVNAMTNDLIKLFLEFKVDYMISPYDASFQLSYLYSKGVIDCVYGSTDALISKIDRFILGMEFQSKDFRFVDKQRVLGELNLTERQFIDLSIMVGCSAQPDTFHHLPTIPKSTSMPSVPQINYFRLALDILYQCTTINGPPADLFGYVSGLNDQSLLDLYCKGHAAIDFMPIMNVDGSVELFCKEVPTLGFDSHGKPRKSDNTSGESKDIKIENAQSISVPSELHAVLCQRLPSEIHFYQSFGLLPRNILEAITTGVLNVRPPLATGDGDSFKKLISSKRVQTLWDKHFNLITQLLARYYQVKRIDVNYWFMKDSILLNNRLDPPVSAFLCDAAPFKELHGSTKSFPVRSIFSRDGNPKAISLDETDALTVSLHRAFVLMRVLDEAGNWGIVGQTMRRFCQENPGVSEKTLEDLLVLLIFVESEGLQSVSYDKFFGKSYKGLKEHELDPNEMRKIFLISGVIATQKLHIFPINYQGPISRSLLAFRSHVKVFHEAIQNSLLVCLVDLITRDVESKTRNLESDKWHDILEHMPFYGDMSNTLLGVVSEIFFSVCVITAKSENSDDQCIEVSKDYLSNYVFQVSKPTYNINLNSVNSVDLQQLEADLGRGVQFWNHFKAMIGIAGEIDSSFMSEADFVLVGEADEIVQKYSPWT